MITISFNIRCANDPDGNSIKERAERLKAVLDNYNADIIGFQEATPEWLDIIKKDYGEKYEIFNRYRDSANLESTPILWKKERFECIDKGYFWLSDTPHIQSDGWDDWKCKRICIWARLFDKQNRKIFNYLNTHYGFGDDCQLKSSDLFIEESTIDSLIIINSINSFSPSVEVETIGGQKPITLLKSRCNVSTANLMGDNSPSETTIRKLPLLKTRKSIPADIHTEWIIKNNKKI